MPTPSPSADQTLLALTFKPDGTLGLDLHWGLMAVAAVVLAGLLIWRLWASRGAFRDLFVAQGEIGVGAAKFTLKPDHQDRQLAFAIWVELATRKASLPFDPEHDILGELYASWYDLFGRTRDLLKTVPVERLNRASTRDIVKATVSLLNDGLRPHLTLWGTHFRAWYELEVEKAKAEKQSFSAHELQQKFPRYPELVADLIEANKKLMQYKEQLYRLATLS